MNDKAPRLFLIDGSSYIFRAYHAIRHLSNSRGEATNAVYGFVNMLLKVVREHEPDHLAVIFDAKGPTFRKEIYPDYKANRAAMPEDLVPQIPVIKEVVEAFNMPALELAGYEADDIIATLARKYAGEGMAVTVVSGDKDLMQIVGERVRLLDTMKDKVIGLEEVAERFGGGPDKVVEVQALAGDASDNIPGVPGVGEKTAVKLVREFGSVEKLLASLDQVKGKLQERLREFGDQALLSKKLVTLVDDVPLECDYASFARSEPDRAALVELFRKLEFHRLLQEFSTQAPGAEHDYRGVFSEAELEEGIAELEKAERISFDTETTSLDPMRAELVGISFAVRPHEAWYVPVGHRYLGAPGQLDRERVLERLRPILEDPGKLKIAQNLKYDLLVLRRAGVAVQGGDFDTMVASYLANPAAKSHGMDNLALELLGRRTITYAEVAGTGRNQVGFAEVEVEKAVEYAAEDADVTLQLADRLGPMVGETGQEKLFREVEMPLVGVLADMEWRGVRVDAGVLGDLSAELSGKLAELEKAIHALAGRSFNVASPKQLGEVLFEELKLPRGRKTKTGWSTDVEVLQRLAAEEHEIAARLLDHRSLAKLKGTYTDALPRLIHPETGRIHTSFNQTVTATGRLSSSDPNLQNIPVRTEEGRRIREAFVPAEGHLLLSADYSQVELRILAHLAGEEVLRESFARGEDIHRRTASEIFGVFPDMVTPEMRRRAKTINFGVLYGMSAFGLAKSLGIGRGEAQQFIDSYFERYPQVAGYLEERREEARRNKYVETLLGRRCAVPEIDSRNPTIRGYAERNAINYPIQGSAADIIKVAMVRLHRRLAAEGLAARMVLQVHDELVLEVPEAELEQVRSLVREEMEGAVELEVPLAVDMGAGKNWREAH